MIKQPKDISVKHGTSTYRLKFDKGFAKDKNDEFKIAQKKMNSEIIRSTRPYVPYASGTLSKSVTIASNDKFIMWNTPYAKRQYYENKGGKGLRGSKWFERSKAANLKSWKKVIGKQID